MEPADPSRTRELSVTASGRGARRREQTRRRLLDAARVVFARYGLADATIAQITQEADLGFGTFYLHFATKERAFRAVIMEGFAELDRQLAETRQRALAQGAPWWEVVRAIVATYYQFAAENQSLFIIMFAGRDAGLGLGRELMEQFADRTASSLAEAQSIMGGQVAPYAYPPDLIAMPIVAALSRAILWWMRQDIGVSPADETDETEAQDRPLSHQADLNEPDGPRISLHELIETMSRFVVAGLAGRIPGEVNDR
jgi:AcrR family transcriptional regulator